MLKQYRNAFLHAIRESGLDPALFNAEQRDQDFVVEIRNSPVRFVATDNPSDFRAFWFRKTKFVPGFPMEGWRWQWIITKPDSIDIVLRSFKTWLHEVAEAYILEKDLPDYWRQFEMYKSVVDNSKVPSGDDGQRLSEEEKREVRESVNQFRAMVSEEFEPTPEQEEFINERLDYLSRAADRLNRFDWNGLAISVVVSIAVNLSVDTERGRILFTLFRAAFQATTKLLQ